MEPVASNATSSARRDSQGDSSSTAHRRIRSSNRTGQACDRCKNRKIRCDAAPGSCGPCRQAHAECRTTDRISGKAQTRGHSEVLEYENRKLRAEVQRCLQMMQNYGVPTDEIDASAGQSQRVGLNGLSCNPARQSKSQASVGSPSSQSSSQSLMTVIPLLTRPEQPKNQTGLKLFFGTKLDIFGMQIDGAEFDDEFQDTETVKSYQGLLIAQKAALSNPRYDEAGKLPAVKSEAMEWARWYFMAIHPFAPVVHKRDFMALIDQLYPHDILDVSIFKDFSVPDKVIVHTTFALIKHQVGQRNAIQTHIDDAICHFITAMTFFARILGGPTVAHAQALVTLAVFARNYMKPEAAWFVIHPAIWACVENGLHRSALTLPEEERVRLTPHEIEMRKRIFWVTFSIATAVSGRLGRPPPIRMQDIDIEFADPVPDILPEEQVNTDAQHCSFVAAIMAAKIASLQAQLYSNAFAVRRNPQSYEADLAQLALEHKAWQAAVPSQLNINTCTDSTKMFALYVAIWDLEFQFFLHHPAIYSESVRNDAHLQKSLDICNKFLPIAEQLSNMRCMDSQWVFVCVLLAVILTTLFIHDVRSAGMTLASFQQLRRDMDSWQNILRSVGEQQGIGSKLQQAFNKIISRSLHHHEQRLATKATPFVTSSVLSREPIANGNTTSFLSINTPHIKIMNQANGLGSKAIANTHQYHPKVETANLIPHTYDSNNPPLLPAPLQQATHTYFAEPSPSPSTTIPYSHNLAYGANPGYQTTTADPNLSFNGVTNPTTTYYAMPGADISPNGNSMMDHWMRWSQHQNINIFAPQQTPQALAQDYMNRASSSLVALGERGMPLDEAAIGAVATAAQQTGRGPEDTRFWPPHYLGYGQAGQQASMGGGPKMEPL